MTTLLDELAAATPAGLLIPDAIKALYDWIEDNGFVQTEVGVRVGTLAALEDFADREADEEDEVEYDIRGGGTDIGFMSHPDPGWSYYFGEDPGPAFTDRLVVIAHSHDGSRIALWRDDGGETRIVHLGSGSGSVWLGVITENAVDFLRLLAIGYDEICWSEYFDAPPNADPEEMGIFIEPNTAFRSWVETRFSVTIPEKGADIVSQTPSMDDETSDDPFWQWTRQFVT